jgi:hypothetical protein
MTPPFDWATPGKHHRGSYESANALGFHKIIPDRRYQLSHQAGMAAILCGRPDQVLIGDLGQFMALTATALRFWSP